MPVPLINREKMAKPRHYSPLIRPQLVKIVEVELL